MKTAIIADLAIFLLWVLTCSAVLIWRSSKTPLRRELVALVVVEVAVKAVTHGFLANPELLELGYLISCLITVCTLQTTFVAWNVVCRNIAHHQTLTTALTSTSRPLRTPTRTPILTRSSNLHRHLRPNECYTDTNANTNISSARFSVTWNVSPERNSPLRKSNALSVLCTL